MGRKKKNEVAVMESAEANENAVAILPYATENSLDLPLDMSFDQWKAYAGYVRVMENGHQWWIGDLLLFAESHGKEFEEQAHQAIAQLNFNEQTLANAMAVAKRFPKARRRPELTHAHHKMVAFMENKKAADDLLAMAVASNWTTATLNEARKEQEAKSVNKRKAKEATPTLPPALTAEQEKALDAMPDDGGPDEEREKALGLAPSEQPEDPEQPGEGEEREPERREADQVAANGATFPITDEEFKAEVVPVCVKARDVLLGVVKNLETPMRDRLDSLNESASAGREVLIEVMDKCEEFGAEAL